MELITYPFALVGGAVFVLWCMLPFLMMLYYSVVAWVKWLTDGKHEIKAPIDTIDRWAANCGDCAPFYVIPGILSVVLFILSCIVYKHNDITFLGSLIKVFYEFPVIAIEWTSTLTFPLAIIFFASFGMRRLFRVGYNISDRLKKVEGSK